LSSPRKVLVISDGHVGSIAGLWPYDFVLPDGRKVGLNDGQRYLLSCWKDFCSFVRRERPDILVINGDWVDGEAYRSLGKESTTTLMAAQKKAAIELLSPILDVAKERYVVQGTEYHDLRSGEAAEDIAREIGAIGPHRGAFSHEFLNLDLDGVVINFSHGISTTTGLYRAVAVDRESLWAGLAKERVSNSDADLIVRSHAHCFVHVEGHSRHALITPCWQLQTRYMRRHSLYRLLPDIGAVLISVYPRLRKEKRDPFVIQKLLYPLPPFPVVKAGRRSVKEERGV